MGKYLNIKMAPWRLEKNKRANNEGYDCSKCKQPILPGEHYRPSSNENYCEQCVGFIASRYHEVFIPDLTNEESYWQNYYENEIREKLLKRMHIQP